MCSHYEAPSPHKVAEAFGAAPFEQGRLDLWPGYIGPFLRRSDERAEDHDSQAPTEGLTCSGLQSKTAVLAISVEFLERHISQF
ncbi:hypothetical protein ALP72_05123 [Pseudomonas coronafaciens pv. coronafaciens]|nr:hypothetical protein ALP72_05123 [Pseudomonas coronafaciens pv. coronafaciens]RMV65728.1 hypothetical protein ALP06_01679 [Pseudomonas coronafaciens pv. atropurpurea]